MLGPVCTTHSALRLGPLASGCCSSPTFPTPTPRQALGSHAVAGEKRWCLGSRCWPQEHTSCPRDSGPFKVKFRAPLQAHPTENTDSRTKTAPNPGDSCAGNALPQLFQIHSTPLQSIAAISALPGKWICYRAGRLLASHPANHQQRLGGAQSESSVPQRPKPKVHKFAWSRDEPQLLHNV